MYVRECLVVNESVRACFQYVRVYKYVACVSGSITLTIPEYDTR